EIVGRAQRVEERGQPEIEDAIQHEQLDLHGKNDIIVVNLATGRGCRRPLRSRLKGRCKMAQVKVGLLATLVAKPGKEEEVAALLSSGLELANQEARTIVWFAFRVDARTFGIFDAFGGEEGRAAHLSGPIASALMAKAPELLAETPKIERVDLLAAKLT